MSNQAMARMPSRHIDHHTTTLYWENRGSQSPGIHAKTPAFLDALRDRALASQARE